MSHNGSTWINDTLEWQAAMRSPISDNASGAQCQGEGLWFSLLRPISVLIISSLLGGQPLTQ